MAPSTSLWLCCHRSSIMSKTFGILQALVHLALIPVTLPYCYKLNMLTYKSTDTEFYRLRMKMYANNTIFSSTSVYKEIPVPMWHLKLLQRGHSHQKIHYEGTIKVCDFWKFVKRVRVFREVASLFFQPETGNLSLECPMPVGYYVLENLWVPQDSRFLKFIYAPNSMYTLFGTVLSALPNNRMDKLCTYEINATISKMC